MQQQKTLGLTPQKFSLKEEGGTLILLKDETPCFCPKLMPFVTQGKMGNAQMTRIPCGIGCAKAHIETEGGQDYFVQTCEGLVVRYPIAEESKEQPEQPKGTIISM